MTTPRHCREYLGRQHGYCRQPTAGQSSLYCPQHTDERATWLARFTGESR